MIVLICFYTNILFKQYVTGKEDIRRTKARYQQGQDWDYHKSEYPRTYEGKELNFLIYPVYMPAPARKTPNQAYYKKNIFYTVHIVRLMYNKLDTYLSRTLQSSCNTFPVNCSSKCQVFLSQLPVIFLEVTYINHPTPH